MLTLAPDVTLVPLVTDSTTWAVVHDGRTALIDCGTRDPARWLAMQGLPAASLVLHTHCQPEHTREGTRLPEACILVHTSERERATDRAAWERRSHTTWDKPEEWMHALGRETYGIAGAITRRPPETPLPIAGTFTPGERVVFGDLTFRVVTLPAHDPEAVGFVLERNGTALAVFSGDLIRAPGVLVNLYNLEYAYHQTALERIPALLRELAALGVPLCPSTGPTITPAAALSLAARIDDYHAALAWETGTYTPTQPPTPLREIGRWHEVAPGVFQIANFGNAILFIDDEGRGLMVDPGPCDFGNPARDADFNADLDRFTREAGLRVIECILVTHPHGDHYDMTPLIRARWPAVRVVALDLVAGVINAPWDHPYPALLPWYGQGRDVRCDDVLTRVAPYRWHDVTIQSEWLPGHTWCHAGYVLAWHGQRIALTGDVIQNRGESQGLFFALCNDSPPGHDAGCLLTMRTMLRHAIDLNLGGHSSRFSACSAFYRESLTRMEHALPFLAVLVPDGDLERACRHPTWPVPRCA